MQEVQRWKIPPSVTSPRILPRTPTNWRWWVGAHGTEARSGVRPPHERWAPLSSRYRRRQRPRGLLRWCRRSFIRRKSRNCSSSRRYSRRCNSGLIDSITLIRISQFWGSSGKQEDVLAWWSLVAFPWSGIFWVIFTKFCLFSKFCF